MATSGRGRAALLRSLLEQATQEVGFNGNPETLPSSTVINGNTVAPTASTGTTTATSAVTTVETSSYESVAAAQVITAVPASSFGVSPILPRGGRGQAILEHVAARLQTIPVVAPFVVDEAAIAAAAGYAPAGAYYYPPAVMVGVPMHVPIPRTTADYIGEDFHQYLPPPPFDETVQVRQKMEAMSMSTRTPPQPQIRKKLAMNFDRGSVPVDVASNYVRIHFKADYGVFEYQVEFEPALDTAKERHAVLDLLVDKIGKTKLFNGEHTLMLPKAVPSKSQVFTFKAKDPESDLEVDVKFTFVGEKPVAHNLRWYNFLFKAIQKDLDMTRIGRNFFMHSERRSVPEYHLEVWPGFVTSVNQFEDGLMLCLDVSHRVLRTETVHEVLGSIEMSHTYKTQAEHLLVKQVVMTRYNNCTHIIDDIAWGETPKDSFVTKAGRQVTYIQYYKEQYNIVIHDEDQPLILCRQKRTKNGVEVEKKADLVRLVPELCYMTGLSEAMRCNHNVMKCISRYNKPSAEERRLALNKYIADVNANEKAKKRLEDWGLVLDSALLHPNAKILDQPRVRMGTDMATRVDVFDAHGKFRDWCAKINEFGIIRAIPLLKWVVIAPIRMRMNVHKFVEAYVKRMSAYLRTNIAPPFIKFIPQDSSRDYLAAIHECDYPEVQLFLIGFMSQREDKYQVVKKLLCQQLPRPSQCVLNRTLNKDNIVPIVNKIALQINCKLGGELWAVEHTIPGVMFVGMDIYVDKNKRNDSIIGFVSSSNEAATQYYAQVQKYVAGQDTAEVCREFMARSLQHWVSKNFGRLPNHVIIYRDGVGDGQLSTIATNEAKAMNSAIFELSQSRPGSVVTFSYVALQKRIPTRLFLLQRNRPAMNPIPGTAVDSGITRRHKYRDFFLVSQTAKEGTVSPTHFVIVEDTSSFRLDEHQTLAYRMTYMYYNWTGSIRIPAPTQYAHKVAHLIGQYVKETPSAALADRLYFL